MSDAPDYQEVTVLQSGGSPTDVPDWQNAVTGPGAVLPVTAAGASPFSVYGSMGFLGVTINPNQTNNTSSASSGRIYLAAFAALASGTVNNLYVEVTTGHSQTAHQNYLMLFDWGAITPATFTLLGATPSGGIDTALASGGILKGALSAGVAVTAGTVYAIGFVFSNNAANFAVLSGISSSVPVNPFGLTHPVSVQSTATGIIAPPSSLAFSACTITTQAWLFYAGP